MELYFSSLVKMKWSASCNAAAFQIFWLSNVELQSVNHAAYKAALGNILVQIPWLQGGSMGFCQGL